MITIDGNVGVGIVNSKGNGAGINAYGIYFISSDGTVFRKIS